MQTPPQLVQSARWSFTIPIRDTRNGACIGLAGMGTRAPLQACIWSVRQMHVTTSCYRWPTACMHPTTYHTNASVSSPKPADLRLNVHICETVVTTLTCSSSDLFLYVDVPSVMAC